MEAETVAVARFATPDEAGSTVDELVVAAIATPTEEWSFKTGPYFGQRGNLNT